MNRPYVAAVSKSPSRAVFLTGNKAQVTLYIDGWKDLLSSVSLFGLEVLLPSVDDCSYEIWWSGTGELTLNHQTRWLMTSRRQRGRLCGRPCFRCTGAKRFVPDLKHRARPGVTNRLTDFGPKTLCGCVVWSRQLQNMFHFSAHVNGLELIGSPPASDTLLLCFW